MRFNQLELNQPTLDALASMGYENPRPIQEQAIPPLLKGRDVVGQARTGTGKTAAFGVPIVDGLGSTRTDGPVALVLVPTRELALQVADVMDELARGSRLRTVTVYGGTGFGKQIDALGRRGPKIIVATPGRLLDLMQRGVARLDKLQFLVLDEADRMLDMGFVPDMRRVRQAAPPCQTALFSATIPAAVRKLVQEFTRDPVEIRVESGETTNPDASHYLVAVERADKTDQLLHLMHEEQPKRALIFTRTKHLATRLAKKLASHGWSSVALQGNMSQSQRERALAEFRQGRARVLVATDVAARGLDVPNITHVVNFDIPEPDAYVHRSGRTARNGATGSAITFVQRDQKRDLRDLERAAGRQLEEIRVEAQGQPPLGPDPRRTLADVKDNQRSRPRNRPQSGGKAWTPRPRGGPRNGGRSQSNGGGKLPYNRPERRHSSADSAPGADHAPPRTPQATGGFGRPQPNGQSGGYGRHKPNGQSGGYGRPKPDGQGNGGHGRPRPSGPGNGGHGRPRSNSQRPTNGGPGRPGPKGKRGYGRPPRRPN